MTDDGLLFALKLASALGCGLIAGVFFAFSSFVMRAFARLPPAEGMAAMQSVNVAVLNPLFLGVFLGTALLCGLAAAASWLRWSGPGSAWLLAGALLYLVGTFLVTVAFNVPRNEALAAVSAVSPASPEAAKLWAGYLVSWTAWNHVRTAAALAAAAAFSVSLRWP